MAEVVLASTDAVVVSKDTVVASKDVKKSKPNKEKVVAPRVITIAENPASRLFKNFLNNEVQVGHYLKTGCIPIGKDKEGKPVLAEIRNPVLDSMAKLSGTIKDQKVQGRWDGKRFGVARSKWNTYKKDNKITV
jgi:hypothetical protein